MVDYFDVEFDSNRLAFYAGQVVAGRVIYHSSRYVNIRSIRIKISGIGQVEWRERISDNRNSQERLNNVERRDEERIYCNSEQYFVFMTNVFNQGHDMEELPPGQYSFPFSTQLPPNLPSSFEGQYGYVRYFIKAKADIPRQSDIVLRKMFSVNAVVDLNMIANAPVRIEREDSKYLCCFCCKSGPITARCWLDRQGYTPGEAISFSAELTNHSNSRMTRSTLKLVQNVEYRACDTRKMSQTVISAVSRPGFEREDFWSDFKLILPPLPPSPFNGCNIISINYSIELSVDPGTWSVNLGIHLPILIGTVPLVQRNPALPPSEFPSAPPLGFQENPLWPSCAGEYSYGATHNVSIGPDDPNKATSYVIGFKPMYFLHQNMDG